jgi:hypothetical protein
MLTVLTNQEALDYFKTFLGMAYTEGELFIAMQAVEAGYDISVAMDRVCSDREKRRGKS